MSKEKITIDDLARLVVNGHQEIMDRFVAVENRLARLEQGQDDIKLRLDNVPYRFEMNELKQRVTVLEKKASFK